MNIVESNQAKAHAVFSASGSHRWMNCPGSIALSKEAPPQVETHAAREGTEAHACLEYLTKNHRRLDAAIKGALRTWSEEMVSHALSALKIILDVKAKAAPGAILETETRVDASPFTCQGQFGTVDAAIVDEFGTLTVIDYKYGSYPVDPEGDDGKGNSQLVYYALGISAKYHHNFERVELLIIQPRSFESSGEIVRRFSMSMDDLLSWQPKFLRAVEACQLAERNADKGQESFKSYLESGSWCKFCPAASLCPELRGKAMEEAKIVFDDNLGLEAVPEPRLLPPIDLGRTLDACEKLEVWIQRVREHAFNVLERGGSITGYKLVDKRAQRKWANENDAEIVIWELFGEDGFTVSKLLSPAQIERLDHWLHDRSELKSIVNKLTIKESSGRTIAKDSDPRDAVNSIQSVFTVIETEADITPPKLMSNKNGKQKRSK